MEMFKVAMRNGGKKTDVSLNSEQDRGDLVAFEIRSGTERIGKYKNLGPALTKFYAQIGKLCLNGWSVERVISKEKA